MPFYFFSVNPVSINGVIHLSSLMRDIPRYTYTGIYLKIQ